MMFRRHHRNDRDFMLYPEPPSHAGYASPPLDVDIGPEAYGFQGVSEGFPSYEPMYADAANFIHKDRTSPTSMYHDDAEVRMPPSNLSTASAPSAPSSTVGSPHSNPGQIAFMPEYQHTGLGVSPGIVNHGDYFNGTEYYSGPGMEEFSIPYDNKPSFVGELAQAPTSTSTPHKLASWGAITSSSAVAVG